MMEFSTYSVISPEGCAAILWKDAQKADLAAKALRMDAGELEKLGVIDGIIKEPLGAAHRNPAEAAANLKGALLDSLKELSDVPTDRLLSERYEKFRRMGVFEGG